MTASNLKKYPVNRPVAIDLFCGAGGLSLGFEQAGFDIALGIDRDGHHVATHERNFPYGESLCASITDLSGNEIRSILGGRNVDCVIGGPPCQGFSHMGLRDMNDPRNSLIDHFMRIVLELQPNVFVMENVPGLKSGKSKSVLDAVVHTAESNGYRITQPIQILDAAQFGVPQSRKRLFVLGIRNELSSSAISYPTIAFDDQLKSLNVNDAISDLPRVDEHDELFSKNDWPYPMTPESEYARIARGIIDNPTDLSIPREWDDEICNGCLRTKHSDKSVDLYAATPPGETVPGHKLPRLHPAGLCPTLRAGSDSNHGSYTAPRPIHPIYPRCITSREAARLHGYPDWFAFYPLKWHAYRQIGNSVCPPVGRALGRSIIECLPVEWTVQKPQTIKLTDEFRLPENRPRTLKRIPQIKQFPPVIDFLFFQRFDLKTQQLTNTQFTFNDVLEAIEKTGVDLHWTRADTFLPEIARSRRTRDLLGSIHQYGYSLAIAESPTVIGEFVPIDSPRSIEIRNSVTVRIDEIHEQTSILFPKRFSLNGSQKGLSKFLKSDTVKRKLFGANHVLKVAALESRASASEFQVELGNRANETTKSICLITCKSSAIPNRARIATMAKFLKSDEVVLLVVATTRHVVAIPFRNCMLEPIESSRITFNLEFELAGSSQ